MKYFSYLLLTSLSMSLLVSCSNSGADKMFGTWTGSTSNSNGERFIKLKITKNNRFELYDSCVFNEIGDPTIANYYSGLIDTDGVFSIYENHPWAGPNSINLKSRSGYTHNYLSGEEAYVRTLETHDPELETLDVFSKGSEEEDPNIDGWFIRTGWFDAVYFNTISWRGSTANLNKLKLTKQSQKVAAIGSAGIQENSIKLIFSQFGNWLSGLKDGVSMGIDYDSYEESLYRNIDSENDYVDEAILQAPVSEAAEEPIDSYVVEIIDDELNPEGLINVSNLNFRSSPEIADNIMGLLDKGDRVIILKTLSINLDNRTKGLLSNSIRINIDGKEVKINKGRSLTLLKHLRDKIICEVDLGKKGLTEIVVSRKDVEIINTESWVKIQRNDTIGYVYARFVDE